MSRVTITQGVKELKNEDIYALGSEQSRKGGGGRKKVTETYPNIKEEIEEIINPHARGNPGNPLLWTGKSVRKLQAALEEKGIEVAFRAISDLLKELGYALLSNRKDLVLKESHPDRNAQFEYINEQAKRFIVEHEPVISIDSKKKENIGDFKNNGAEWRKSKEPVKVGISGDTAEFAADSILKWWEIVGKKAYPKATKIMITADCGGSNGNRARLWKVKLQEISDRLKIAIQVTHYPPGTSKWNKIEHRLFSYISINWRGKPLDELLTVINLIASTTTAAGLTVDCICDMQEYKKGIDVTDDELSAVNIIPHDFHGEWNYAIMPNL